MAKFSYLSIYISDVLCITENGCFFMYLYLNVRISALVTHKKIFIFIRKLMENTYLTNTHLITRSLKKDIGPR